MRHRTTEDTLFLMGGALLGAAAMYLMDPQAGQRRRQRLAQATEGAYDSARQSLSHGWEYASDRAHDVAESLSSKTSDWQDQMSESSKRLSHQARQIASDLTGRAQAQGSHLHDWGSSLWNKARSLGNRLTHMGGSMAEDAQQGVSDRAHDWGKWLSKRGRKATRQAKSWFGHQQEHEGFGATTMTSSILGACALGLGAMYFFDPDRGRSRRAWIGQKTTSALRDTSCTMRGMGRDLANRFRGMFYGTRSRARNMLTSTKTDSDLLVRRIRSELGHLSPSYGQIQIMADADGTVTLTGALLRKEIDSLLTYLHRIPGVNNVVNRLNVREEAQKSESGAGQTMSR